MYERDVARMQPLSDLSDEQIKSIKASSFIVIGDRDVTTTEHVVEMQSLITNSRLAIIPGGHDDYLGEITTAQNSTVIAATVSMINNFLSEPAAK